MKPIKKNHFLSENLAKKVFFKSLKNTNKMSQHSGMTQYEIQVKL